MSNDHCRFLINMYRTQGISAEQSVNMVQHLLDTDMLADYPEFVLLSEYYLAEGLCYFVPTISEGN